MDVSEYERVGKLIFGVQRLEFLLDGLHQQFAGNQARLPDPDQVPAIKLSSRMAASEAYFSSNSTPAAVVDTFKRAAALVCELETNTKAITAGRVQNLDDMQAKMHEAHRTVADIMHALGTSGYSTGAL